MNNIFAKSHYNCSNNSSELDGVYVFVMSGIEKDMLEEAIGNVNFVPKDV